ncbi:DUF2339 domain-containing protein, partial [Thioclava sp. BHET1]
VKANWAYVISAFSLSLAGIFFVQYGIENGLLPPAARVVMAILFGIVLIGAGEWIRRRYSDQGASSMAFLPSTFSGAGLVSIFAGIVAARQLYELLGPGAAFVGLLLTAAAAVVLGWFYGPFLAAVGLIGASLAPFAVGGDGGQHPWLYLYFGVITAVGLAVDAVRRWAWISVLALALGYGCIWLLYAGWGDALPLFLVLAVLPLLAIALPV